MRLAKPKVLNIKDDNSNILTSDLGSEVFKSRLENADSLK